MDTAQVKEYKVKSGDSLLSIARKHGMTWQQLAIFNWNTCIPYEINRHLRDEVGCSKKTVDNNNYIFTDEDIPGIIRIPVRRFRRNKRCRARPAGKIRSPKKSKGVNKYQIAESILKVKVETGEGVIEDGVNVIIESTTMSYFEETDVDGVSSFDGIIADDYSVRLDYGEKYISSSIDVRVEASGTTIATLKVKKFNVVHVFTDDPTFRGSLGSWIGEKNTQCHAMEHHSLKKIQNVNELLAFIWSQKETPIDYLDFHTHGNAGLIGFKEDNLSIWNVDRLYEQDFAASFDKYAHIEFHGCNVGEDFEGETFLYIICEALLKKGGKVGASTGGGLALPVPVNAAPGCTPHPFGDWVRWEAMVDEEGNVAIRGKNIKYPFEKTLRSTRKKLEHSQDVFTKNWLVLKRSTAIFTLLDEAQTYIDRAATEDSRLDLAKGRWQLKIAEQMIIEDLYRPTVVK